MAKNLVNLVSKEKLVKNDEFDKYLEVSLDEQKYVCEEKEHDSVYITEASWLCGWWKIDLPIFPICP